MATLNIEPSYGSDRNGLICGYLFAADAAGRPITLDEALVWLVSPAAVGREFIWLHFTSVALLNHLLHDQGDVLVRIVREATLQVDGIEDSLQLGKLRKKRADLGKLRRVLVRLQRLLAREPGSLFRLLRQPPARIALSNLDELRQSTEEFSLVLRDLAALKERIKLLQEEIAAQVGEQTNRD